MYAYLQALVRYALERKLIEECDEVYITNQLLQIMGESGFEPAEPVEAPLEEILNALTDEAVKRGLCEDNIVSRDLFDTKLMGVLTPRPSYVWDTYLRLRKEESPEKATDWFYRFCQDTNYIRRDRIAKDVKWKTETPYGALDITINLSKPEKDPKAIAAAGAAPQTGYPKCQLCIENEGYAGRMNHPARQNHRVVPILLEGEKWYVQYSPYVYYNEHCIVFSHKHSPIVIDLGTFNKLLNFVHFYPHYFVGSNADLPIVGGSILSHEHFQGGHYCFPMEKAPVERELTFREFERIEAGIVRWPMSALRLRGKDRYKVALLAEKIRVCWREYTDEAANIYAETDGVPHNTITPIARYKDGMYEMDLVLRNNLTTEEHPSGVYHPHEELHHIKKENIGLIEVMGLAVLPSRLKKELGGLEEAILNDLPLTGDLEKHAPWVEELKQKHCFTKENITDILREEVGLVFAKVLEHAGVFYGKEEAFLRFVDYVNQKGSEWKSWC